MTSENKNVSSGGILFVGLLQIVFIVLKLCNVVGWSWVTIFLPFIISGGLTILTLIGLLILLSKVIGIYLHEKI
jgi:hypothetical protein